jgi:hypothetical protein
MEIEQELFRDIYVSYNINLVGESGELEEMNFTTKSVDGVKEENFEYAKQHHYENFNSRILGYLLNNNVI